MIPELTIDLEALLKSTEDTYGYLAFCQKQARFAFSQALNQAAVDMLVGLALLLEQNLTVRTPWVLKGWRIIKDVKTNAIPMAAIYHKDDYLNRQEYGGGKSPRPGRSHLTVPARYIRPAGPSAGRERIRGDIAPKVAMASRMAFRMGGRGERGGRGDPIKLGGVEVMMYRKRGTQKATRRFGATLARAAFGRKKADKVKARGRILSREVRVLYLMPKRSDVRERLKAHAFVMRHAPAQVHAYFPRFYKAALESAK